MNLRNKTYPFRVKTILIFTFLLLIWQLGCEKLDPKRVIKVALGDITDIQLNSCTVEGIILDLGGSTATQHGLCWAQHEKPTVNDSLVELGSINSAGTFKYDISNLSANSTYYVRAYLRKGNDTYFSEAKSFTTLNGALPTVTTAAVDDISAYTATSGGNVIDTGSTNVISKGVCWSTTANPTISDSTTNDGTGMGSFVSSITGLNAGTAYFVRAYATNSVGTSYGTQRTFTTIVFNKPTVSTDSVTNISHNSAECGGKITNNGGDEIIAKGVCWSISPEPTINDDTTNDGSGSEDFISNLINLNSNTVYYVRAYAANGEGTSYGDSYSFTTKPAPAIDFEGNIYQAVQIGDQIWMAENLKSIQYADGTPLINGIDAGDLQGDYTTKYYFNYNDDPGLADTKGRLYSWAAVMNDAASSASTPSGVQGICPSGWHVPSDAEWMELEVYLGMDPDSLENESWRGVDEGGKLKEVGTAHWIAPNTGATNSSGFTAIPGGIRFQINFGFENSMATFWSATESSSSSGYYRALEYDKQTIYRFRAVKFCGTSVRCIKD